MAIKRIALALLFVTTVGLVELATPVPSDAQWRNEYGGYYHAFPSSFYGFGDVRSGVIYPGAPYYPGYGPPYYSGYVAVSSVTNAKWLE